MRLCPSAFLSSPFGLRLWRPHEVEISIPREMPGAEGIQSARDFVAEQSVTRGMIADLNVHWDIGADGEAKPHAHGMLATRAVGSEGSGTKVREWNRTDLLREWRERWAFLSNERLAELRLDLRIDHRSYAAQGIELEPQNKIGSAGGGARTVARKPSGRPSTRRSHSGMASGSSPSRSGCWRQSPDSNRPSRGAIRCGSSTSTR